MKKLNFLITEDEELVREGMIALLKKTDYVNKIYEAVNGHETISCIHQHTVDILLLDIKLPDMHGLKAIETLAAQKKAVKIIVVTGLEGHELILNLIKSGVQGIVFKMNGFSEIRQAVSLVAGGGVYYSEEVRKLLKHFSEKIFNVPPVNLNEREVMLLKCIVDGDTSKQIAAKLNLNSRTLETHRKRLLAKVQVPNTAALLAYAFRNGIIQ